ncbi:hypothetical protein P691DRAFT_768832 [Macrolepiota fuliginosa MF-IS2]|uniref:Uncharacterized protein n=1 Tax=Macrolepiota fuliginosa MF-IS2 TaxID=1400762 RepID=A0A9P5WXR5_9AGAR|nr:hypothetical protein P691DRAFT_768832 [Macrolepiota fuliginosa MF-IS2]
MTSQGPTSRASLTNSSRTDLSPPINKTISESQQVFHFTTTIQHQLQGVIQSLQNLCISIQNKQNPLSTLLMNLSLSSPIAEVVDPTKPTNPYPANYQTIPINLHCVTGETSDEEKESSDEENDLEVVSNKGNNVMGAEEHVLIPPGQQLVLMISGHTSDYRITPLPPVYNNVHINEILCLAMDSSCYKYTLLHHPSLCLPVALYLSWTLP